VNRATAAAWVSALVAIVGASALSAQAPEFHRFATAQSGTTQKLAFDERRGRMVRIDSSAFENVFATWEWIDND
jgi:hypothetical protein